MLLGASAEANCVAADEALMAHAFRRAICLTACFLTSSFGFGADEEEGACCIGERNMRDIIRLVGHASLCGRSSAISCHFSPKMKERKKLGHSNCHRELCSDPMSLMGLCLVHCGVWY